MSKPQQSDEKLIKSFEEGITSAAKPVESDSGKAFVTYVRLEDFFPKHGHGELYQDWGLDVAMLLLGISETNLLVDFYAGDGAPISWTWNLSSFRIGERGYIMLWAEPDVEAGEPVLGFWEPYDNQHAFEKCFVGAYANNIDPIVAAPQLTLGSRVSNELMASALWQGLRSENGSLLLTYLEIDEDDPSKVTREMVAQYVDRATGR